MYQHLKHAADQERYLQFLSNAMGNNNQNGITQWVKDKLLDQSANTTKGTREAFFKAEKILLNSYIQTNDTQKIIQLVQAINQNENKKLISYECNLLLLALREQKSSLINNQEQQKELKDFLSTECHKLEVEDQNHIINEINKFFDVELAGEAI